MYNFQEAELSHGDLSATPNCYKVVNRIPNETDQNESNHLLAWVACVSWLICNLATVLSASLTPRKVAQRVSSNVIISYQERRN